MKDDREFGSPHWSKDFVEHLRTVHFALITVSVGLVLLVLSARPFDPGAAVAQFGNLQKAATNFDLAQLLSKYSYVAGREFDLEAKLPTNDVLLDLRFPEFWVLQSADGAYLNENAPEYQEYTRKLTGNDIVALRDWWAVHNRDTKFTVGVDMQEAGNVAKNHRTYKAVLGDEVPYGFAPPSKDVNFRLYHLSYLSEKNKANFLFEGEYKSSDSSLQFLFPAKVKEVILRPSDFAIVPNGCASFDSCFPDLVKATKGLETLSLSDLRSHLIQQLEKGDSVFEAFGLKIPVAQLTFWGIVVVLSVQLYFLLHLREFHAKIRPRDTGWDVPWIGVYPSVLSRAVYFTTTTVMPVVAVALLAYRATVSRVQAFVHANRWDIRSLIVLEIALLVFSAVMSALLSWVAWKHSPTLVDRGVAKAAAAAEPHVLHNSGVMDDVDQHS
jgi:hypothetical protein